MTYFPATFIGLVMAIQAGLLLKIIGYANNAPPFFGRPCATPLFGVVNGLPPIDVHAPNFHFGFLFDRGHPDFVGRQAYALLLAMGWQALSQGQLNFPSPECNYLFNFEEDVLDFDRIYCVSIDARTILIDLHQFIRQMPPGGGVFGQWILDCTSARITNGSGLQFAHGIPAHAASPATFHAMRSQAKSWAEDTLVATMLLDASLNLTTVNQIKDRHVNRYNRQLPRNAVKVAHPTVVDLDRSALAKLVARQTDTTKQEV